MDRVKMDVTFYWGSFYYIYVQYISSRGRYTHGSRNRMCSPIDTSYWFSSLILKFYWSNFSCNWEAMGNGHGSNFQIRTLNKSEWTISRCHIHFSSGHEVDIVHPAPISVTICHHRKPINVLIIISARVIKYKLKPNSYWCSTMEIQSYC